MGINSDTESEISDSEKDEYQEKIYDQIIDGKYKIKNPNATLRCPFCEGKKKSAYQFKDLLQHASGIGTSSSKRSVKVKAKHLALAKYLKVDLSNELDGTNVNPEPEEVNEEHPNTDERFVWPWKGIVANIFNYDDEHWLRKFEPYKPKETHVLHRAGDPTGYVVLDFGRDWDGFRQVMKLDTDFITSNHGKEDWGLMRIKDHYSEELYAWCAKEEDYNSIGIVGTYLREKAELKTTSNISQVASEEKSQTVAKLAGEIDSANDIIIEVETKYQETNIRLHDIMQETDLLHKLHAQEMERMQQDARKHAFQVKLENEKLKRDIHTKSVELDRWCQKLSEQESLTIYERRKFEEEKKRKTESLILASEEQAKANRDFVSLLEKHQIEKKTQTDALLKLERELTDEHKLELEIAELQGQLKVLKYMNVMGSDPSSRKKEIKEMEEKLEMMIEELSEQKDYTEALMMKEERVKTELEDARQEIIAVLPKILKKSTSIGGIGIKKIGEINAKPFQNVCKNRYKANRRAIEAAKLHKKWQDEILDSTWHPFRIDEVEGQGKQEVIDEDDVKLSTLKNDLGEEAYEVVVTALKELNEYNTPNSSRRSVISELWNFKTGSKAKLSEVFAAIMKAVYKKR